MKKEDLLVVFQFLADVLKEETKPEFKPEVRTEITTQKDANKYCIDLEDKAKTAHIKGLMDRLDEKYMVSEEDNLKNLIANQRKQFDDTIKKLRHDLKDVINPIRTAQSEKTPVEYLTELAQKMAKEKVEPPLKTVYDEIHKLKHTLDHNTANSEIQKLKDEFRRDDELEEQKPQVRFRDEFANGFNRFNSSKKINE